MPWEQPRGPNPAFARQVVAYPTRDPKLEIVNLRKDPLVLAVNPQHPFAKLKSIRNKNLTGQKFISFERDIPTRRAVDKILKEHGGQVNVEGRPGGGTRFILEIPAVLPTTGMETMV